MHKYHYYGQNASHTRQIPKITMSKNAFSAKINVAVNLHRHNRQNVFPINSNPHYFHQKGTKKAQTPLIC